MCPPYANPGDELELLCPEEVDELVYTEGENLNSKN